ncbi:MAG: hypothetical protein A4E53_04659 [Pelotomaculum sp. PtaB.Bin104]|nr:MAG: hypothetical protein A4E53_04659 [Pelotomaculum sp. PtaB.Bin104]
MARYAGCSNQKANSPGSGIARGSGEKEETRLYLYQYCNNCRINVQDVYSKGKQLRCLLIRGLSWILKNLA